MHKFVLSRFAHYNSPETADPRKNPLIHCTMEGKHKYIRIHFQANKLMSECDEVV